MSDRILRLEQKYLRQMSPIRERVVAFGAERGWRPLRRGRHAHASIYGEVNGLSGVLDVELEFDTWDECPEKLSDSTPFVVFAGVFLDSSEGRYMDRNDYRQKTTFGELREHVDEFLAEAWQHLSTRTSNDTTDGPHPLG